MKYLILHCLKHKFNLKTFTLVQLSLYVQDNITVQAAYFRTPDCLCRMQLAYVAIYLTSSFAIRYQTITLRLYTNEQ